MSFLKRVQSQSSSVKAQYAFVGAGLITGVIGIVWVSTIPARFADISGENIVEEEKETSGIIEVLEKTKKQVANSINWNTETEEEKEVTLSPDTALGALTIESAPQATTTPEKAVVAAPHTQEKVVATTSTPPSTNEEEKTPQSKVILIATTTSQKSE